MRRDDRNIYQDDAKSGLNKVWLLGVLIALAPIAIALYYLFVWQPQQDARTETPLDTKIPTITYDTPPPPPVGTEPDVTQPLPPKAVETAPPLPELNKSDETVISALSNLILDNEWLTWITTDEVVRKFVVVTDNIAEGKIARKYISIPKPNQAFRVETRGEKEFLQPSSYERYNRYIEIFDAIDTDLLVATYRRFSPLLEQAYGELGYPDRTFHSTLMRTLEVMLDAPIIEGEIELTHTSVLYKFADPKLEKLPAIHKQFLRMGPRNTAIAQRKIRELKEALRK